jgi:carbamoyltransferase
VASPLRQYTTHHDTFGIWHLPGVKVRFPVAGNKSYYIRTNSIGIRDDREFTPARLDDTRRIQLYGDSFTFGSGVDVEKRYSNLIEQKMDNLEIMNFGLGSTGIDRQLLIYLHLGRRYESDLIMVNPYLNNVARCTGTFNIYQDRAGNLIKKPKPYYTIENDELALHNVPVPREVDDNSAITDENLDAEQHRLGKNQFSLKSKLIHNYFLHTNYKYWLIKLLPIQPYPEYNTPDHPAWRLSKRILLEFPRQSGGTAVYAPMPSWSIIMNPKLALYRDRYKELHNPERGSYFIDILPYFLALGYRDRVNCFISKDDYHYSEAGHQVVADGLADELNKLNLL